MTTFAEAESAIVATPVSILIVDDNPAKRVALRAAMTPLGHRIVEAESGLAALRNLMTQDFAVILLDVRMPIMDGFETAALVRQRQRSELTPIVFITAYRDGEIGSDDHFVEGVGEVMYAPVDPDELRRKVATFAELFVRSQPDLPVGNQEIVSRPPEPNPVDKWSRLGRILVVEDNLVSQRITVMTLEALGYHVDAVSDGAAAVQIASARQYDTILMDCHMPKVSGYEAAAAIRLLEGKGRYTPIVAVTGSTQLVDRERCFAEGMNAYLSKPFSKAELAAAIAGAIAGNPSAEALEPRDPTTLDAAVIATLRRLGQAVGEDLVGELTKLFLVNADIQLGVLRNSAAHGDSSALFQAAHALSGASANLGAVLLARLCDSLAVEAAKGARRNNNTVRQAMEAIDEELIRVRTACQLLATR